MKSLLILSFITLAALMESSQMTTPNDQVLAMQLSSEIEFEEYVKIYDYDGNLLKEYLKSDVVNDNIVISDYMLLEESDFAFSYLGDYYYFTDDLFTVEVN